MKSNDKKQVKQSPGGNSSLDFGWQRQNQCKDPVLVEETKLSQDLQNERLDKILKAEAKRKELCKKEIKTSVKVNKPPGGVNNFFFG